MVAGVPVDRRLVETPTDISRPHSHFFGCQTPVPKGRQSVARGASPWTTASSNTKAPEGRQTATSMGGRRPPIRQTQWPGLGRLGLAPTSGVLSPRWGLAARPFAFQGLAPLATDLGSSGAGTPEQGSSGAGTPEQGSSGTGAPEQGSSGAGKPELGSSGAGAAEQGSSGAGTRNTLFVLDNLFLGLLAPLVF